jgi:alpha-L-fucosidase
MRILFILLCLGMIQSTHAVDPPIPLNKPERVERFQDLGLGVFIHWSMDSQLGSVISHSMVGASDDYLERFIFDLPKTFNPSKFDPHEWAVLCKLAGFKYVVFTAKHHSGFCMFDTQTTDFNIMNTPYGKDICADLVEAFRAQGLDIGFYFSPDDFHFLYQNGIQIRRVGENVTVKDNLALRKFDNAQLKELLSNYGKIDILFIDGMDGAAHGLLEPSWALQPDLLITRGAMETPEQEIPGEPLPGPWEACFTMGTQWHYKPTHEEYKSGTKVIEMLIETRAKGGNLLLNLGPKPNGEIPIEQEERLRELALWMFINQESIYTIRPWAVTNEGDIWFTKAKDEDTVYAFITKTPMVLGETKTVTLKSVTSSAETQISVLGQSGDVIEYQPDVNPQTVWNQTENGLTITFTRAQRIHNDKKWPNPIVIKITHANPTQE